VLIFPAIAPLISELKHSLKCQLILCTLNHSLSFVGWESREEQLPYLACLIGVHDHLIEQRHPLQYPRRKRTAILELIMGNYVSQSIRNLQVQILTPSTTTRAVNESRKILRPTWEVSKSHSLSSYQPPLIRMLPCY
jgi:hypothetical protein